MPGQERRRGWQQWRGDYATDAPVGSDSRSDEVSPLSGAIAGQAYTRQPAEAAWRPQETEFDDAQVPQLERLHALGRRLLELHDENALMTEAMQAAADLVRAPCATAQMRAGSGLRLVATSGLPEEYLDPFRYIDQNGITTCAAALRERRRVLVVNFDFAPGFAAFAREAAALHLRAAVSTPVLDENSEVVAMFTLYFDRPFQPTARDLRMLDLCAQQVAPHLQRARISAELHENFSFSRALLDGSIDCVKVLDAQGRVLSINGAGRRLLELDDGAHVEGRYWHELLHPACRPIVESAIAGALAGQPQKFEMFSPTATGKPRWWESGISRVRDGEAGADRLLVISRDVTARKRNEQVLAEQQRLLEMIASGCRLPECLHDITEAVSRMDPDARACVLLLDENGESFGEVHSATVPVSFGERIRGLRIEGLDNDTCGATVHSGHPLDCDDIERDHSCSWRELCLEYDVRACHSVPIRGVEGNTVGAFLMVFASPGELSRWHARIAEFGAYLAGIAIDRNRDVHAREHARHQLADSLQRERSARHDAEGMARDSAWLASIVTHSTDAIISKDLGGIITSWNESAERLFGYTAAEAIGQPVTILMPPDRIGEEPGILARIRAGEVVDHFETVRRHKDGRLLDISLTIAPIRNTRGEVIGASKIARDISARKESEERQALLAEIDEAVVEAESEAAIIQAMSQRIGARLDLHCCCLIGVDEPRDAAWVDGVWYAGEVPVLPRRAALSDFVGSAFIERARAGEMVVVRDAFADPRTDGAAYARYEVASFITVPWTHEGAWRGLLAFCDNKPRDWRRDEIGLVRELAARVLPRIMRARAEEQLRTSEARYHSLVDQVVSGIAEEDLEGRFVTVNDQYCRMLGYEREELLGMRMHDVTHPADLPRNLELFDRCVSEGSSFEIEKRYLRKDGTTVWVHNSVSAVRDAQGRPRSLATVSIDITESKRAEKELLASLARERAARKEAEILVEASSMLSSGLEFDALVQKMTDLATHLIGAEYGSFFYNVTGEDGGSYMLYALSGADRAQFENMPMPRNTPLFQPTFAGTGIVRCGDVLQHPDFGREAPSHGLPEGHLPVRSYLAVPVVSSKGKVHGGLFFAHSECDRFDERAERLVQGIAAHAATALDNAEAYRGIAVSETHLRQILDAMPSAVYTTDAQGRLTYFNPAAVEFAGRSPQLGSDEWCVSWKLYNADGTPLPHDQCPMARALRENRAINGVEAIAERSDGTRRWFMPFPTPLHDEHGNLVGGINMLVDITERKQADELVAQAHARVEAQRRLYDTILSNTPDLAYVFDLDHRFIYANEALLAMWGKTREEALGKNCLELGYPGWHAAMHDRELDQVISSKRPLRGEVPFTGTQGRRIYDYIFVPVLGPDGEVEAVAGTTRDVTQQKEIEHRQRFLLDVSDRLRLLDDPGAIRHVAAEALARELGVSAAGFVEIEPDGETLVAGGEYCDGRMPDISGRRFSMEGVGSGYAPLVLAGENVFIEDYEGDMRIAGGNEGGRDLGLSSGAGVAVYNMGTHAAYLYLMHPQPRAWPEADRQLVREVAERSWSAVERVRAVDAMRRSETELAEELADMQLLTTVGAELVQEPTAEALFVRIVETAAALMRADCAVVHILDSERGELNLRAQIGLTPEAEQSLAWVGADAQLPSAMALRDNRRVVVGDVRQNEAVGGDGLAIFERDGINAAQSTPLIARNGRLVGMLSTHWRQRHMPSERRLALLDLLARQAADLIENRRHEQKLLELNAFLERRVVERTADLEQSEQQVRRMASMLTMAEHQERRRISQVLHDDLQQQLHSIQMKLSAARAAIGQGKFDSAIRHLEVAENWSGEGVDTARRLTVDLSPPILKSEGLAESLEWLVSQMRKMHGLDVVLAGERDLQLRDDAKRVLIYQIVRELLFNVVKYANTSNARIELRRSDRHMEICVVDEGVGFDPQKLRYEPQPGGGGFGLTSANERLALVGGSLEIESAPGFGTSVTLRVPRDSIMAGNDAAQASDDQLGDIPPEAFDRADERPDWQKPDWNDGQVA